MDQIVIRTLLSTKDALAAGAVRAGDHEYAVTPELLAACSPEQRALLHELAYVPDPHSYTYDGLWISAAPSDAAVLAGLSAESERRAAKVREQQAQIDRERDSYRELIRRAEAHELYFDLKKKEEGVNWAYAPNYSRDDDEARALWGRYVDLATAERERVIREADAALDLSDAARRDEILAACPTSETEVAWAPRAYAAREAARTAEREAEERTEREAAERVREAVTLHAPQLLERHDAGVLPGDELSGALRTVLLAPFDDFGRYERITADEVRAVCADENGEEYGCDHAVRFEVADVESHPLNDTQWQRLKTIRAIAEEHGCSVTLRLHRGDTSAMEGYYDRLGVRVCCEYAPGKRVCREIAV